MVCHSFLPDFCSFLRVSTFCVWILASFGGKTRMQGCFLSGWTSCVWQRFKSTQNGTSIGAAFSYETPKKAAITVCCQNVTHPAGFKGCSWLRHWLAIYFAIFCDLQLNSERAWSTVSNAKLDFCFLTDSLRPRADFLFFHEFSPILEIKFFWVFSSICSGFPVRNTRIRQQEKLFITAGWTRDKNALAGVVLGGGRGDGGQ